MSIYSVEKITGWSDSNPNSIDYAVIKNGKILEIWHYEKDAQASMKFWQEKDKEN